MPLPSKQDDPLGHYAYKLGEAEQEIKHLLELLDNIDTTLQLHGHMDANTDLHKRIKEALPQRDELPNCVWRGAATPFADNH